MLLGTALIATIHNGLIAETEHADIKAEITKRHDEAVKRLQDWIAQVSIAAEDRGYPEGTNYMAKHARDAGVQQATVINTDGKPGRVRDARRGCAENGRAVFQATDFDPQNRDENIDYYVAKLDDLVKKFSGLTTAASAPTQENLAF